MENNDNFTKNYRDSMGIMSPEPIAPAREYPRYSGSGRLQDNLKRIMMQQIEMPDQIAENDGGDPYAISNMQVMDNIRSLGDSLRNSLLDIFGGAIGVGKRNDPSDNSTTPDEIFIDIDGVINNLKRISGGNWDKNYIPRQGGWIRLPYPSGAKSTEKKMPNYSGNDSTYNYLNGGR